MKAWTVMVYMAGDNDLDAAGVADITEMKKIGSNDDIDVVVQFDRRGRGIGTARYHLTKNATLNADLIGDSLGETNDGDPNALVDFILWAAKQYPAKRYLAVLWNHGNGWDDEDVYAGTRGFALTRRGRVLQKPAGPASRLPIATANLGGAQRLRRAFFATSARRALAAAASGGARTRGILYDDNAKDFLDNVELKKVLLAVRRKLRRRLDVLGMDACLMSMAEVAYQVREGASFMIGSEQTEPTDGWPYTDVLGALARKPSMTPAELSRVVVRKYLDSYGARDSVTQAAIDLSRSEALVAAIKALGTALSAGLADDATVAAILRVRTQVQTYETPENVDLPDLCHLLGDAIGPRTAIGRACAKTLAAATGARGLVIASGSKGGDVVHSGGVAIYFPTKNVSDLYATLDFERKSGWGKFLEKYLAATRRRPR